MAIEIFEFNQRPDLGKLLIEVRKEDKSISLMDLYRSKDKWFCVIFSNNSKAGGVENVKRISE